MAIFDTAASASPGSVPVYGYAVAVSKWTVAAADTPGALPTFGAFAVDNRLKFLDCFVGSSVVGMSYARLALAVGEPFSPLNVEDLGAVLSRGDRVLIGVYDTEARDTPRWIWAGYCTRVQLVIGENREQVVYRCHGPEWLWGGETGTGAHRIMSGQIRRKAAADSAWLADTATITPIEDLIGLRAEPAIFNPGGRGNRTDSDVEIESTIPEHGYIWEIPDRLRMGAAAAQRWRVLDALRTCFYVLNFPEETGISLGDTAAIPAAAHLRATSVEGCGLWEALRRVCGADYAFWVDNRPTDMAWQDFTLNFFARATGPAASLILNPRGTSPALADASVTRLDVTSDIEKCVNRVRLLGKNLVHLSLRYRGRETTATPPVNTLQHGWTKAEGDTLTFARNINPNYVVGGTGAQGPRWEVTDITIDATGNRTLYRDRYTTSGKDFDKYRHVFRLFTWNEGAEWFTNTLDTTQQPFYPEGGKAGGAGAEAGTGVTVNWTAPDVGLVWGATGSHTRRRRRLLEGRWQETTVDTFRKLEPILFMAFKTVAGPLSDWFRVPKSKYNLDPERAAVWFTEEDLATWMPFEREQNADDSLPNDPRSFLTLIHQGVLRLALEGCIEQDEAELAYPAMPLDSGSPYRRIAVIRSEAEFLKITEYAGGDGFVLTATGSLADDTTLATSTATQAMEAGKDAQVHSSILVASDWPRQEIGSTISSIAGRGISMLVGQAGLTGRPAQIVALRMDGEANKWELLTESAALALKDTLRRASADQRDRRAARRRASKGIHVNQHTTHG